MRGNKARQLEADRKLVEENQHLLPVEERERVAAALEGTEEEAQDAEAALVDGEEEEEDAEEDVEMSTLTAQEEAALAKEEEAKNAKVPAAKGKKTKGKRKVAVVGQADGMDIDA